MENQQDIIKAKNLLIGTYRRLRNGQISKEQAKHESELLINIIKAIEIGELKNQIRHLNALLTSNKKQENENK